MTELSDRLKRDLEDGQSIRGIGRKAGMSNSTVRRAIQGEPLDHGTIEKFAKYLKLPINEVYQMAGLLPPMYDQSGRLSRDFLLSKLWEVLARLPESDQALVLAEAIRLSEKYNRDEETNP